MLVPTLLFSVTLHATVVAWSLDTTMTGASTGTSLFLVRKVISFVPNLSIAIALLLETSYLSKRCLVTAIVVDSDFLIFHLRSSLISSNAQCGTTCESL